MDARKTISAVLGIRFPCVSLVLKVTDLDNFTFFKIKLLITMKAYILSKNKSRLSKKMKFDSRKTLAGFFINFLHNFFYGWKVCRKKCPFRR